MIELIVEDEHGQHYATETFLTTQDAKDYLYLLECALDDARGPAETHRLRTMIAQLEDSITEAEQTEDEL